MGKEKNRILMHHTMHIAFVLNLIHKFRQCIILQNAKISELYVIFGEKFLLLQRFLLHRMFNLNTLMLNS